MFEACLEKNREQAEEHELISLAGTPFDSSVAYENALYLESALDGTKLPLNHSSPAEMIVAQKASQLSHTDERAAISLKAAHSLTLRLEQQQQALLRLAAQRAQQATSSRPSPAAAAQPAAALRPLPASSSLPPAPPSLTPTRIPAPPPGYRGTPGRSGPGFAYRTVAGLQRHDATSRAVQRQGVLLEELMEGGEGMGTTNPLFRWEWAEGTPKPSLIQRMEAAHAQELQQQQEAHCAELAEMQSRHSMLLSEAEIGFQRELQALRGRHAAALEAAEGSQREAAARFRAHLQEVQQRHAQQVQRLEEELRAAREEGGHPLRRPLSGHRQPAPPKAIKGGVGRMRRDENERQLLLSPSPPPPSKTPASKLRRSELTDEGGGRGPARPPLLQVENS